MVTIRFESLVTGSLRIRYDSGEEVVTNLQPGDLKDIWLGKLDLMNDDRVVSIDMCGNKHNYHRIYERDRIGLANDTWRKLGQLYLYQILKEELLNYGDIKTVCLKPEYFGNYRFIIKSIGSYTWTTTTKAFVELIYLGSGKIGPRFIQLDFIRTTIEADLDLLMKHYHTYVLEIIPRELLYYGVTDTDRKLSQEYIYPGFSEYSKLFYRDPGYISNGDLDENFNDVPWPYSVIISFDPSYVPTGKSWNTVEDKVGPRYDSIEELLRTYEELDRQD